MIAGSTLLRPAYRDARLFVLSCRDRGAVGVDERNCGTVSSSVTVTNSGETD